MKVCESCGYPMKDKQDHGGADSNNKYCKYCAPDGKLLSKEKIRKGWIQASMRMHGLSEQEATKRVDEKMPQMPAWKGKK